MNQLFNTTPTINPFLGFAICTLIIILSGVRLSKYGNVISEKTGLSKAWVGLILLASVTSLPELITGISSVTIVSAPDIAVGDVLGSCCFNLLILSVIDAFIKPKPLSSVVRRGHVLTGAFGILMITLVVVHLIYPSYIPSFGWVSTSSIMFILIYLLALKLIFHHEQKDAEIISEIIIENKPNEMQLSTALYRYIINSVFVVCGAMALPYFANNISIDYGIQQSFVGTLLVATATSLPELVVSIASVRMGAVDMAVGNLFGSNLFNIAILAIDDIFYAKGILLESVSPNHVLSALAAIMMTAVAAIGLTFRAERKRIILAMDTLVILFIYLALIYILYISTK